MESLDAESLDAESLDAESLDAAPLSAPPFHGEFPIQPAKVQRPFLRQETLERDRLLDWLHRRIHSRLVLVTAEAGYGKTTLLADFSRRTRLRTAWYRLDELDRNTISFLHYLVAAGREVDPGFAPGTAALLRELGTMAVSEDRIVETFLRELGRLGSEATILIIDDYHLVDDVPDVRRLMRQVVASAPERLTVVLISRRRPTLPLARLRSLGEVAELAAGDLRFSLDETERLFRDTYGQPLEADVLSDLTRRTEGWAASLELVRTALHNRNAVEIRSFVRSLNGASHELYDYLAEEVVGDLEPEAQQFLMRTAVLQIVRPDLAGVASELDADRVQEHIRAAERLGLLGGRGERSPRSHRYHPLVRDFLLHRLGREIGADGLAALHLTVARHADGTDWVLAAHHYAEARSGVDVRRVITSSLAEVMGRGEFALAESYLNRFPPDEPDAAFEVILSRLEYYTGSGSEAVIRANRAFDQAGSGQLSDVAAVNLMTLRVNLGDAKGALEVADHISRSARDKGLIEIASSMRGLLEASLDGDLRPVARLLERASARQQEHGHIHYVGVSLLNLACVYYLEGRVESAISAASAAVDSLAGTSNATERHVARSVLAAALLHAGRHDEAEPIVQSVIEMAPDPVRAEVLAEIGDAVSAFFDPVEGQRLLDLAVDALPANPGADPFVRQCRGRSLMRVGRPDDAESDLKSWSGGQLTPYIGLEAARLNGLAMLALHRDVDRARALARQANALATRQGAGLQERIARMLVAICGPEAQMSAAVSDMYVRDPAILSALAEHVAGRLDELGAAAAEAVRAEACRRPERWRHALRQVLDGSPTSEKLIPAALLLEEIGDATDVMRLRGLARALRSRRHAAIGRKLIRRVAAKVFVEDLGRVRIRVGDRAVHSRAVRRKVLALLAYLVARPDLSATSDQVIEALWPDADPDDAGNSLNQTVYFLRRLIEPAYREDTSPGFVHHRSDLIWLDSELVDSQSRRCGRLLRDFAATRDPALVEELSQQYTARFALDFEYEDWADAYRDALHTSFLEVVERQVRADVETGEFDRGIGLARAVLSVDPDAATVEGSLIRLYGLAGAHAAAAEQQEHYAGHADDDERTWSDR